MTLYRTALVAGRARVALLMRAISTDAAGSATGTLQLHGLHELPAHPAGIIECREYTTRPDGTKPYLTLCAAHAEQRRRLSPFLGMFACDTGGSLTTLMHIYHYRVRQNSIRLPIS